LSYLPLDQVGIKDGPALDAFGNLRVSQPVSLFGTSQEYNYHPLLWDHHTASGGTATHATATNSTVLSTAATTSGARAMRQSKIYLRYTPGKSQLIKMTGTLRKSGTASGTSYAGIGYYDDESGLFFRYNSSGVAVVERSSVSGSRVDTAVLQANWNLDKLDGTGQSGLTIDWTKEQIFVIDFQWLGVGRVRFGVALRGMVNYVHEVYNANTTTSVYMRTACLPPRYEVFNEGGVGANISVEAVCTSVESEGGVHEDEYYAFVYSAYLTPVSLDTTMRPYITRRIRDVFNGLTCRGHAHLNSFDILVGTNNIYWEVRYNATVTIGGVTTTTNVDATNSISEYDTYTGAANTITGGVVVANGFGVPGAGSNKGLLGIQNLGSRPLLGRTYAGVRDSYTLCARSLSGAATMSVAVQLQEQY